MLVRPVAPPDLPAVAAISAATGQHGRDTGTNPSYLRLLLDTARVLVAVDGDRRLGWGAVRETPLGSMLTDLFVDPAEHGHGVGRTLLASLWPDADQLGRLTFSSQHPNALPAYARAGLRPVWPLLYLSGPAARLPATSAGVVPVDPVQAAAADLELIGTGGTGRVADYAFWAAEPGAQAFTVTDHGDLIAAGIRHGGELIHLTCVDDSRAGPALYAALAPSAEDQQVHACLPGPHPTIVTLVRVGFRVDDYDLAMTTPDLSLPITWVYSPGLA